MLEVVYYIANVENEFVVSSKTQIASQAQAKIASIIDPATLIVEEPLLFDFWCQNK